MVKRKINPPNTWTDLDSCLKIARDIKEGFGLDRLPSERKLRKIGYGGLGASISNRHGGFSKFRNFLGEEPSKAGGRGKRAKKPAKRELMRLYLDENLGTTRIGRIYSVTAMTARGWLIREGISLRKEQKEMYSGLSRRELRKLYITEKKSTIRIARIYGTTPTTIRNWLIKNEIPIRNPSKTANPYEDFKKLKREFKRIIGELGHFPSQHELRKLKIKSLVSAVERHHGGLLAVRDAMGYSLVQQIKTSRQLEQFLQETPQASDIGSLVTATENVGDVAEVFVHLWPDRFPSASDLARSLPSAVQRIGHSLHPFTMDKARGLYDKLQTTSGEIQYILGDILFQISVDQYQQQFNDDPQGTLEELSKHAKARNGFGKLARRVHGYYK